MRVPEREQEATQELHRREAPVRRNSTPWRSYLVSQSPANRGAGGTLFDKSTLRHEAAPVQIA